MRIAKWVGIVLLGLVVLLLAGAWLITRFIDPQRFKPQIAAAVRDITGRELQLRGPLALSWFPFLALETRDGALDGGGADAPLVGWRRLRVGTRLLPLIDGELRLDRVQIDGLTVNLRRDAAGVGNWQSLLDKLKAPGGGSSYSLSHIAGITLVDAAIEHRWADGSAVRLQHLNLDASEIASGKPVALRAAFDFLPVGSAVATAFKVDTIATLQGDQLALRDLELSASRQNAGQAAAPLRVALSAAALKGDLATQLWELPAATLSSGEATLQISGASLQLGAGAPTAAARFVLAPTSPRALLGSAGISAPATRDARALGRVAASGSAQYSGDGLKLNFDTLQLDDTRLSGTVTALAANGLTEFSFTGDSMDLDRYRSPENTPGEPFVFPTAELAALRARGSLSLRRAQAMGADLRGVTLRLLLADGRLQDVPAAPPAAAR